MCGSQIAALCVVLSFGSALAQQSAADVPTAVETTLASWIEAFNRGAPTGAYFASDAVLVRGNGTFNGAAVIDDMEQREAKAGLRLTLKVERVQSVAPDTAIVVGRYAVALPGPTGQVIPGVSLHVLQRTGNEWKVRAASFTRVQVPPPPSSAAPGSTNALK
jgi:ketosteroid isomerase-like protein